MADLPVFNLVRGTNADLIAEVARLHLKPHHLVADLTWGKGVFWKKVGRVWLIGSDADPEKAPGGNVQDLGATTYPDHTFDRVVLDPPYAHTGKNCSQVMFKGRYGLEMIGSFNYQQILQIYRRGLEEGLRIARPGGQLWVKCKPELESGRQRWADEDIHAIARGLGIYQKDKFYLEPTGQMVNARWRTQHHARKRLSMLLVLEVPKPRRRARVQQQVAAPAVQVCHGM